MLRRTAIVSYTYPEGTDPRHIQVAEMERIIAMRKTAAFLKGNRRDPTMQHIATILEKEAQSMLNAVVSEITQSGLDQRRNP